MRALKLLVEIRGYTMMSNLLADYREKSLSTRISSVKKNRFLNLANVTEQSMEKFHNTSPIRDLKRDAKFFGYDFSLTDLAFRDMFDSVVAQIEIEGGYFILKNEVTEYHLKNLILQHFEIERPSLLPSKEQLKKIGKELNKFSQVTRLKVKNDGLSCLIECKNSMLYTFHIHSDLEYIDDILKRVNVLKKQLKEHQDSLCNYDQLIMAFDKLK